MKIRESIRNISKVRGRADASIFAVAALLAGCTVGPNYHRPTAPVPATWDVQEPWRESAPKDLIPKGEWWTVFHDEELSSLEKQALDANQTIKISVARLEQARATAAIQIATLFPVVGLEPGTTPTIERQRLSGIDPLAARLLPERSHKIRLRCPSQSAMKSISSGGDAGALSQRKRRIRRVPRSWRTFAWLLPRSWREIIFRCASWTARLGF